MNLNDFVVPNNTTRSVKLNARNSQKSQSDTTTLASERTNMEEKSEQSKENMSKEKEERGHFRDIRWKFGQCISSDSNPQPNSFKRTNDNKIQKLSAGKLKIRISKDEPSTAPPPSAPSPSVPSSGLGMTKRSRVKGATSRHCEIKSAKLTDTQDQVINQDISCFQRQINPGSFPGIYNTESSRSTDSNHSTAFPAITTREDEKPEIGTKGEEKQTNSLPYYSQVSVVKHEEEKAAGVIEDNKSELADPVFTGHYSEEESARSFQEASLQWRKERRDKKRNLVTTDVSWTPIGPGGINRNVSATSTQTDLPPGREAERQKREGAEGKLTVKSEFSENSLTYMDRLLLKKHRRTPVESPPSSAFAMDLKSSPTTDTEEEMTSSLTEEDFRQYCSSLFNIPVSENRTEPSASTPGSCLFIEVLNEISRDVNTVSFSEQKFDDNRMISKAEHSSPCSTQPSRPSVTSVQPKTGKKPQRPHNQNSKHDNLDKDGGDKMSSDSLCSTPPEEDSCEEEAQIHGLLPRDYDSFRPAEKNMEIVLQTEDTDKTPQTQVMQNQTAGFGSEQFCDSDGFSPLGLDTDTGRPDSPEQTHYDGLHTYQFSVRDSDSTVWCSHGSLGRHSEECLNSEAMKDSYEERMGIQIHSTTREEMNSANELRTSEFGLARCPLSQASQAIMEICSVDQAGCEDPDVDSDMSARMSHSMEHELRLSATTQCMPIQALELESGDSGRENQDESFQTGWDQQ